MRKLHLTAEDMQDLLAGHTINAMIDGGEEVITSADWTAKREVSITGGAYRFANVTLTAGAFTVSESERVDKHYEPHFDAPPHRARKVTQALIEAATLDAVKVAEDRAAGILNALMGVEVAR